MAKGQKTRDVVRRPQAAGFTRTSSVGSHSKWVHPSGVRISVPDGHRAISPGVVRKIDNAINESEQK